MNTIANEQAFKKVFFAPIMGTIDTQSVTIKTRRAVPTIQLSAFQHGRFDS
jgi:hypothetical protein